MNQKYEKAFEDFLLEKIYSKTKINFSVIKKFLKIPLKTVKRSKKEPNEIKKYYNEGKTKQQLMKKFHIGHHALDRLLLTKETKKEYNSYKLSDVIIKQICNLYQNQKLSITELSRRLNIGKFTIKWYLYLNNIKIRNQKEFYHTPEGQKAIETSIKNFLNIPTSFTKLEFQGYKILDNLAIAYEKQYNINNRYIIDAFIPRINYCIEFDDNYWHQDKEKIKKEMNGYNNKVIILLDLVKQKFIKILKK